MEAAATEGVDYVVDHGDGKVTALPHGRFADGDEATVRFVPLPVSRTSDEPHIVPMEVVFPSTKAPPPPTVVDVVPAFSRQRSTVGDNGDSEHIVSHDGGVLRLYLARPWNVSGDGEKLAVLLDRSARGGARASCVARDPIVTGTTSPLTPDAFTRRSAVVAADDGIHDLVIHEVEYDSDSGRWFADIGVATFMYRPFLRLVVARYQADSVVGEDLSAVVVLEPVRLGVTRTVTVREAVGWRCLRRHVTGPDHGGMTADDGTATVLTNKIVVTNQRADPSIADSDLRWQVDVSSVPLQHSAHGPVGTWTGTIAAPADGSPRRLVVTEHEPALTGSAVALVGTEAVHVEVVELPA